MPLFSALMKYALTLLCLTVLAASLALPQSTGTAAKKKTTPAQTKAGTQKSASAKKTATATRTVATARTPAASKKGRPSAKKPVVAAVTRTRQLAPTPDRYKEIQQALVDKGYLKSEPSGVWDADSTEALKQFQTDKKLTPTGKITAPSLIGLGLGPRISETSSPDQPALPAADTATPSAN
jgi:hypothetical protein